MQPKPTSCFSVREACLADLEIITEYNWRLALETEEKELDRTTLRAGVSVFLNESAKGQYFVAEQNGHVVGQTMYTTEWSDWRNGEFWWLGSVYVAKEYRQQGVFRLLYNTVVDRARSNKNVIGVRLYVEQENTTAQATYKKLGFEKPGYAVMETLKL